MSPTLKNFIYTFIFNFSLFLVLIIAIQNSSKKEKINFFFDETIELPISFITGSSFIAGSLFGSLLSINFYHKKIDS